PRVDPREPDRLHAPAAERNPHGQSDAGCTAHPDSGPGHDAHAEEVAPPTRRRRRPHGAALRAAFSMPMVARATSLELRIHSIEFSGEIFDEGGSIPLSASVPLEISILAERDGDTLSFTAHQLSPSPSGVVRLLPGDTSNPPEASWTWDPG